MQHLTRGALLLLALLALPAFATPLHVSQKLTALDWRAPGDTTLYPARTGAGFFWRTRLASDWFPTPATRAEVAVEESDRWTTAPTVLPSLTGALAGGAMPYRAAQLKWTTVNDAHYVEQVEVDRAAYSFRMGNTDVTLGRQTVGLGRGALFNALDVLLPFSPLEVDREWRPGVDALTVSAHLSSTASLGGILAAGRTWDDSAALVRVMGYRKGIDGQLVAGKRARDGMLGVAVSAPVGGAEVHAEWAAFCLPADAPTADTGWGHTVTKAVVGGSRVFKVGRGLWVLGEYHYNGFGGKTPEAINTLLATPDFRARAARGDLQTAGREGTAVQASLPLDDVHVASLNWVTNPRDGSGVVTPALTWNINDSHSLLLSAHLPYGRTPDGAALRSEYGAAPASVTVQMAIYE
jgi:hypothetical protein